MSNGTLYRYGFATAAVLAAGAGAGAGCPGYETVGSAQKVSAVSGGFAGLLEASDKFGSSVASIGDLDGDGVIDLAVGAELDDDGGGGIGAVWVLFMHADGTVKGEQKVSATDGGLVGPLDNFDLFGKSIAALGDLDGDGVPDMAVGAAFDDDGGDDRGAVWVLFMNADGTVKGEQKISSTAGGFGGALDDNDQFGFGVAGIGDLDGDGITELAIGARFDDDGGDNRGAAWILFLNDDGTVEHEQKISATAGGFGGALDATDLFGISIASLGDLDGDGVPDIAAGAYLDDDGGVNSGAVWILFLNADGTVKGEQKISGTAGGFEADAGSLQLFGVGVVSMGDVDGDGVIDLAVGEMDDDDGGANRGAVWLLFLHADGTVKAQQKISDTAGGFAGGLHNADRFGISVAAIAGGGGPVRLAVGTLDDDGAADAGAVWIITLDGGYPTGCPADLTIDGQVGSADLNELLASFGDAAEPGCRIDIDGSGLVDSGDLNQLLSAFGTACGS